MFGILKGKIIDYDEADREMASIWDEYFETPDFDE
jgi:hypothetical protein